MQTTSFLERGTLVKDDELVPQINNYMYALYIVINFPPNQQNLESGMVYWMQHLLIHPSSPKKGAAVEETGTSPVLAVLGGIISA